MKALIYVTLLLTACLSVFSAQAAKSPYDAARSGDLDTLRQYRFEGIDLFVPDERGFIPYELSALHADPEKEGALRRHVEVMLWLKEYQPKKHRYGKASTALVQAGLNALGYPVGKPDGIMGKKTADAIRAYQNDNDLAQTGRLGPQWLGEFYQDVVKDMQFKLTRLGFDTKGTDGLMGRNTRNAMLKYREKNMLSNPDYPHVDALLINSINNADATAEKRKKAAIAKKAQQAEEKKIRFAQAGFRTLGYRIGKVDGAFGSKTANAIKKFQTKYKLPVNGKIDKATQLKMDSIFLKETQRKLSYLGYKVGKPDGKMGKKTQKALAAFHKNKKTGGNGFTSALIMSVDDAFDTQVAKATKKSTKKKSKSSSKKTVTKKTKSKQSSKKSTQKSAKKSAQKSTKKTTAKKSTKSSSKKTSTKKATQKRPSKDVVKTSSGGTKKTSAVRGNKARGRMSFKRKGGRVVGCSIAGRGIPIEWCEPFYPLPKNNHCEALFKPSSGTVLNLWCK